jgi:hypothetical protein
MPITHAQVVLICELIPRLTRAYNEVFNKMDTENKTFLHEIASHQSKGAALLASDNPTSEEAEIWIKEAHEKINTVFPRSISLQARLLGII